MSDVEVLQSAQSATRYETTIGDYEVVLTFLNATKGRMDFAIDVDGQPCGKVNVLSQHSIARLTKTHVEEDDRELFNNTMLKVGIVLRDGTYTPAPIPDRIEAEVETYEGETSTFGAIGDGTIGDFLGEPNLLDRINDILHNSREQPFVGDSANLMLTFLVFLSCKTSKPLNLEMIGQSASGKTYMTLTARNGFPKSMTMVLAGASREALKYDYDEIDADGNFIVNVGNRCIVVLEKDESQPFIRKMKPLMSGDDDELIWKTPVKNEMTGEIETRDFIIRGQPSFITLTTRNPTEAEQITRQLLMTPDTSPDKVNTVVSNILKAHARPEEFTIHPDVSMLQASMLHLKPYRVRNIFAPLMAEFFPARNAQHQRDIGKVLSIIDSLTLLHQRQRPVQKVGDDEFLLASIEDNVVGLLLCDLVLRASLSGVPDTTWTVFTEMQKMADSRRPLTVDAILQWLHLHSTSLSKNALVEKHLPTLEDAGLIEIAKRGGGRGGARKTYKIVAHRVGLMDAYALAPLFVEAARREIHNTLVEYDDVISATVKPEFSRRLAAGEADLLKGLGCATKDESLILRSLLLPNYLRAGMRGLLWEVLADSKHRSSMFTGRAWLEDLGTGDTATERLEKKREVKEKVKKSTLSVSVEDDDVWESMLDAHLEDLE